MAQIPGSVRVAGFMAPTDSTDTYAVTDPIYGRGSLRSVATTTDRNNITSDRRQLGMEVVITTSPTLDKYRLINNPGTPGTTDSDWELISNSGGVSVNFIWDATDQFSVFYTKNNIASLSYHAVIELSGTGHTIDAGNYLKFDLISFNYGEPSDGASTKQINISDGVTLNDLPNLLDNVILSSNSTTAICVDPPKLLNGGMYIGNGSMLQTASVGKKFITYTAIPGAALLFNLDNGTIYNGGGSNVLSIIGASTTYLHIQFHGFNAGISPTSFSSSSAPINIRLYYDSNVETIYQQSNFTNITNIASFVTTYYSNSSNIGNDSNVVGDNVTDALNNLNQATSYTNANPTTITVGGISAGTILTNETYSQFVSDLLYPYQNPSFSSFGISGQATTIEVGASISGAHTFIWTTTNSANVQSNSINIYDITGAQTLFTGLANDGSEPYTFPTPIQLTSQGSYVWQIQGTNTQLAIFNRNYTVNWYYRRHWGTSPNTSLTSAQILALISSDLSTIGMGSPSYAAGDYKYWCIPSSFTQPTTFKDHDTGFAVAMESAVTVSVTNAYGIVTNYSVYRTTYTIGSTITIDIT